ncbi:MAG: hypothetical protein IKD00_05435 [Candidatus Methanomethylophilaceae archaeon]|nr:hypothetical protein [Candidatus Methanomethylophilaceae archaeon]
MMRTDYESIRWEDGVELAPWVERTSFPEQLRFGMGFSKKYDYKAGKVCIFSTTGSCTAGDILCDYSNEFSDVCISSYSSARLPGWVDSDTDLFLVSYSGSVGELKGVLEKAKQSGCRIHAVTSDRDWELIHGLDCDVCILPKGMASDCATGLILGALVGMLDSLGVSGIRDDFEAMVPVLREYRDFFLLDDDWLKGMRCFFKGKVPSFYSYPHMRSVGKRWRTTFIKEIGDLAFDSEFPEFNHNEIVGWADAKEHSWDLLPVFFSRGVVLNMNDAILSCTLEVLDSKGRDYLIIDFEGCNDLERILKGVMMADFVNFKGCLQ